MSVEVVFFSWTASITFTAVEGFEAIAAAALTESRGEIVED